MDPLAGWNIIIKTNNSVITPQDLTVEGNLLTANYTVGLSELINCVNGGAGVPIGKPGNIGCTSSDGPGLAQSAVIALGAPSETPPINGLLFKIDYTVAGPGNHSAIEALVSQISSSSGYPVQHNSLPGGYGTAPDFGLFPDQTQLSVTQGGSRASTIILSSNRGFTGSVNLTATSVSGLNISLIPATVILSSGGTNKTVLSILAKASTPAIQYTIIVSAKSGSLTHDTVINISVLLPADFIIDANPGLLRIHAADSATTSIILASNQKFSGNVTLNSTITDAVTGKPAQGVRASLSPTLVVLAADGLATSTLTITTPPASLPFKYTVTLTATSGQLSHSIDIVVKPPSPDLGFTVTPRSISVVAGSSEKLDVTLTSIDYFQGSIYLFATAFSGIRLSFNPSSVDFDLGNKTTSSIVTLTLKTDPTTVLGLHSVVLTAISASIVHSTNMTLTVRSPPSQAVKSAPITIFGMAPWVYFGILVALAMILVVATIMEARKERHPSILLQRSTSLDVNFSRILSKRPSGAGSGI